MYTSLDLLAVLLLALFSVPSSHGWGEVGHGTVAAIAASYLTPETDALVRNTLLTNETLVSVASWADAYRRTPQGKFSGDFHFIDAEDNPPTSCNVSYKRDCIGSGCIVSAIKNYTERVQDPMLPTVEIYQALKFLVHFLGDITQPLHDEAQAFGGNKILVTWNGKIRNLHGVWDDEMPNQLAGGSGSDAIASLSKDLRGKIQDGTFPADKVAKWVSCVDPTKAEDCALDWATDANRWICTYVLKNDVAGKELNGTYYDGAVPVIQEQLAKGGLRLAYFLNNIVAAASGTQHTVSDADELKM